MRCLEVVIRRVAQVLAFSFCLGSAMPALPAGTKKLRCFAVSPGLILREQEVAGIIEAVRQSSGRPVITIEPPNVTDYAPKGVVEVLTLASGTCDSGCGDRLWVRKGKNGWRVLKKLDGKCWLTLTQQALGPTPVCWKARVLPDRPSARDGPRVPPVRSCLPANPTRRR
jgi:hypothetical protein